MKSANMSLRLLLVGAGPRIVIAGVIIAVLWLGFLWATSTPGSL